MSDTHAIRSAQLAYFEAYDNARFIHMLSAIALATGESVDQVENWQTSAGFHLVTHVLDTAEFYAGVRPTGKHRDILDALIRYPFAAPAVLAFLQPFIVQE